MNGAGIQKKKRNLVKIILIGDLKVLLNKLFRH